MLSNRCFRHLLILAAIALASTTLRAEQISEEQAWKALPQYEYGQDLAALLVIDRAVIRCHQSPEARAACAARLAAVLASDHSTVAAKQYVCLKLRDVGTEAEVPLLAKLLEKPETSQMARYALEAIPGDEASAALRAALTRLQGKLLVGVIHSVAARGDLAAEPVLEQLAGSSDREVAAAAVWALGNLADDRATEFLIRRAKAAGTPLPQELAVPLLRCAHACLESDRTKTARLIFQQLAQAGQPNGPRRAALEGLLRIEGKQAAETIAEWFTEGDPERQRVATAHLSSLTDAQFDALLERLPKLAPGAKLALLEAAAVRRGEQLIPTLTAMVQSERPELKLAGIRALGTVGTSEVIPLLVDQLAAEQAVSKAAQEALANLPRKDVTAALLSALQQRPAIRRPVIAVLGKLKCYEAIDPLIEIAARSDPDQYGPALEGLRTIADPDNTDIPRLLKLLLRTEPGRHRDEVEKTILIVCQKLPPGADRAAPVLAALGKIDRSDLPSVLPLLGRLGGAKALEMIHQAQEHADPNVRRAAIRALCNWPTAEVADELLQLATGAKEQAHRRWALRAYIRVITLPSDRPEAQTLAMLQEAMKLATEPDDKRLIVRRAGAVRTMEAVTWIAQFLDDPQLNQAACQAIVELAHHRFLRHPNMDRFGPILEKVEKTSKDPAVVQRAKRYRLGL